MNVTKHDVKMSAMNSAARETSMSKPYMSNSGSFYQYGTYTGLAILTAEIMEICKFIPYGIIFFLLIYESSKYKLLEYPKCM